MSNTPDHRAKIRNILWSYEDNLHLPELVDRATAELDAAYLAAVLALIGEGQVLHDYDMDAEGWKEYKKNQFSMKDLAEADMKLRNELRTALTRELGEGK